MGRGKASVPRNPHRWRSRVRQQATTYSRHAQATRETPAAARGRSAAACCARGWSDGGRPAHQPVAPSRHRARRQRRAPWAPMIAVGPAGRCGLAHTAPAVARGETASSASSSFFGLLLIQERRPAARNVRSLPTTCITIACTRVYTGHAKSRQRYGT